MYKHDAAIINLFIGRRSVFRYTNFAADRDVVYLNCTVVALSIASTQAIHKFTNMFPCARFNATYSQYRRRQMSATQPKYEVVYVMGLDIYGNILLNKRVCIGYNVKGFILHSLTTMDWFIGVISVLCVISVDIQLFDRIRVSIYGVWLRKSIVVLYR